MTKRECDLCKYNIGKDKNGQDKGVHFNGYDLCNDCITLVRMAICRKCKGTGKINEVDHGATMAQANCGENRTQYKTIICPHCHPIKNKEY